MSYTNKTPNYDLPQWLGNDKPAWLTDMNGAFSAIDTAIKGASDSGSSAEAIANNALSTAQSAQETAGTALSTANEAKTDAGNATTIANNASQQAGTALTNANNALTLATSAVECYSKIDLFTADMIGPGLNLREVRPVNRRILFYYPGLHLMEITYVAPSNGTPTDSVINELEPTRKDYKLIKLPFTCTGSATINGATYFITSGEQGMSSVRYSWLTVRNISNETWVCLSDLSVLPAPSGSQIQANFWINTNNLGTITLDGWTKI